MVHGTVRVAQRSALTPRAAFSLESTRQSNQEQPPRLQCKGHLGHNLTTGGECYLRSEICSDSSCLITTMES
jgi:hypothetical protein